MIKKLNEVFDETRLRLLSIDRLREHVLETLNANETDEETLEQLSTEVQRRLGKASKAKARVDLQEIADRIYRHKLMRAAQEGDELAPLLNARKRESIPSIDDDRDFQSISTCMCSVPNNPADCYAVDSR